MEPNWPCRVEAVQGLSDQRRLIRSPPPIGPRSVAGGLFWGIAGEAAIHDLVARSCMGLKIGRTFATQADRNRQWSLTVEGTEDPCFRFVGPCPDGRPVVWRWFRTDDAQRRRGAPNRDRCQRSQSQNLQRFCQFRHGPGDGRRSLSPQLGAGPMRRGYGRPHDGPGRWPSGRRLQFDLRFLIDGLRLRRTGRPAPPLSEIFHFPCSRSTTASTIAVGSAGLAMILHRGHSLRRARRFCADWPV